MKVKFKFKKVIFWLIIILLANVWIYRFALWPSVDIKNRINKNITLIEKLYLDVENYKLVNWIYPDNIKINDFIWNDDIYRWNKYWLYQILNNNEDFIIWIKLINLKYVNKNNWNIYNDFFYKSSYLPKTSEIEYIYNNRFGYLK